MKTRLVVIAALFFAPFSLFSQKSPVKFGNVTMDEMQMTRYEKDTSASAVVLADYGEAYVVVGTSSVSLNFERHVRIKILKTDGLRWADAIIPLYESGTDEENISGLKAMSYNLEGGKIVETKLGKDGIFRERFNKNINHVKFTIPNAKEGSVLEFTYKISSDFLSNFPNWQFQYEIPVVHSEYWAIIPEFFTFEKYMQGYVTATSYEIKPMNSGGFTAQGHHWIIKDVPAFKPEPFMAGESNYISKVNFALSHFTPPGGFAQEIMGSWEKLNSSLLASESFGKAITGSGFLKKTVEEITAGITDPNQKIAAIHHYVRHNIEWNGTKDYLASPIRKILDEKKATSGDINITLAAMLDKAGIESTMVLLSTRDHGFVRQQVPMAKQFNYVVCEVMIDGKPVMIDATERYLPLHILPERCLNQIGFRVSSTRPGWVEIKPGAKARTVVSADLTLNEDGELQGTLSYQAEGYDAGQARRKYLAAGEDEYFKSILDPNWEVESRSIDGINKLDDAVRAKYELTIAEHATVTGDLIYVSPFVAGRTEQKFKLETRVYPIDFGSPIEKTYMCKLIIPDGYEVDEMPQSKMLALPQNAGRYIFNASQTGNMITFTSMVSINKNLFIQDEYPLLREFYNQVVAKEAEQIVLKKKSN